MTGDLKSLFLKEFIQWKPELVSQMRECNHSLTIDNPNPFHVEDTVWSHTMMVVKLIKLSDDIFLDVARIVSAICHDIGKIQCRDVKIETGRVRFFNHEYASVQHTLDFLYHLKNNGFLSKIDIDDELFFSLINLCTVVVSNHLEGFKRSLNFKEFVAFTNNSIDIATVLVDLMSADHYGRFFLNEVDEESTMNTLNKAISFLQIYSNQHFFDNSDEKIPIYIMGGVAGCGKDFIASNYTIDNDRVVLSFDDIRIEEFRKHNQVHNGISSTELYNLAWEWCQKERIDFLPILKQKMLSAISEGKSVFISNTNCNRNGRKKLLNAISNGLRKKYSFNMLYVTSDLNTALSRNKKRVNDKVLHDDVVLRFAYNQQIPLLLEGFDNVEIIAN